MNQNVRSYVAEGMGTFWLTFIGAGSIIATKVGFGGNITTVALAHGLALAMAVYATAHISGGHINPAITLGMLLTKKIKPPDAFWYIFAQLFGAITAACLLKFSFPDKAVAAAKLGATLGTPQAMAALGAWKVLMVEAILTFFLMTTIYAVAVDKRGPQNVYGFAIGLTVCLCILAAGPITGASMNPARSFGPAFIGKAWDMHWVYWVGPILGSAAAALTYDRFFMAKGKKK